MDIIKINPVILQNTQLEEETSPTEVILIAPDITTISDTPPAIEIEPDYVNVVLTTPQGDIDYLVNLSGIIKNYDEFILAIKEVLIRFDSDPKRYTKLDYIKLILAITSCFKHLYNLDISSWSITSWTGNETDDTIPTSKLVKDTLDLIDKRFCWIIYYEPDDDNDTNE